MALSKITCAQHLIRAVWPYGKEYERKNVGVRFIEPANKPMPKHREIRWNNSIEMGRINPTPTRIRGTQAKISEGHSQDRQDACPTKCGEKQNLDKSLKNYMLKKSTGKIVTTLRQ